MHRAKSGSRVVVMMSAVLRQGAVLAAILVAGCAGPETGGEATVFEGAASS